METTDQKIKEEVRERYTRAVTGESSCCKPGCCGGEVETLIPTDRVVSTAGRKINEWVKS